MRRAGLGAVCALFASTGLGLGCSTPPPASPNSFTEVYAQVIGPRCSNPYCHFYGIGLRIGAMDMSSRVRAYWNLVDQPVTGPSCALMGTRVVPFQPETSIMYRKVAPMPPCGSRMPADTTTLLTTQATVFSGAALSSDQLQLIFNWIAEGAQNN